MDGIDLHVKTHRKDNGVLISEEFQRAGKLHRDPAEGPAEIIYDLFTGKKSREGYFQGGIENRALSEGPSTVFYDERGRICGERYCVDGRLHRPEEHGPARQSWDERTHALTHVDYYLDGEKHRNPSNGPASVWLSPKGVMTLEEYYVQGKRHRDPQDGPAVIRRNGHNGRVMMTQYWQDGIEVTGRRPAKPKKNASPKKDQKPEPGSK